MSQGCPGIWNLPILHSQIEKKKKNALLFGYQNLFSAHVLIGETAVNSGCKESQLACHSHVLANKSFQLAPKPFLISRIDYHPSVIWISQKHSTCPSGKLRTKITSPIAKSTSPGLSDTTFFARCNFYVSYWRWDNHFLGHLSHAKV